MATALMKYCILISSDLRAETVNDVNDISAVLKLHPLIIGIASETIEFLAATVYSYSLHPPVIGSALWNTMWSAYSVR